jgi:hypothetical protein
MIQPKIEKVYKNIKEEFVLDFDPTAIEEHEGYFFTPEEFEQFKREFGKELLEKAANSAYIDNNHQQGSCWDSDDFEVNKESITSVLDDYLLNNKV